MKPDIEAPIVPDYGLGGFVLRNRIAKSQELLTGLGVLKKGSFRLVSPFEARYILDNGEIEIAVDTRNGKIFKLSAHPGYRGTLFEHIRVGMPVWQVLKIEPRIYYSEAEGAFFCRGVEGLTLDVPDSDAPPDIVPSMIISAISVFAVEILTARGQDGDW
jgi:hypothetical protein